MAKAWQNDNQEQGREGEEDRREDGEMTLPPTLTQPGLGQRKTEEVGSYLRRATSDSGWCSHEWVSEWAKQACTHNVRPEIWKIPIFKCMRKPERPEKTYEGGYGIGKPNSHTTTG